jgi:hypothetical protein
MTTPNQNFHDVNSYDAPDFETIREQAIISGGIDPLSLRFRILEFEKSTGDFVGVPVADIGFQDAVETAAQLISRSLESHFCLEPVGFLQ